MKKHFFYALFAALCSIVGFTSCGGDDVPDPDVPDPVVPDPVVPDLPHPEMVNKPFFVTAKEEGATIWFSLSTADKTYFTEASLMYSLDGETWQNYTFDKHITISPAGMRIYFKAGSKAEPEKKNTSFKKYYQTKSNKSYISLASTKEVAVSGNILSLLYGDNPGEKFLDDTEEDVFANFFKDCNGLVSAADLVLPTNTKPGCFRSLFSGCPKLKETPILRATELTESCYVKMFESCTVLEKAPVLPATVLANDCYSGMFSTCRAMKEAPQLPATKLTASCYEKMFESCSVLENAPALPATVLAPDCYSGMFYLCKGMRQAPQLPATSLADRCYKEMFSKCYSLGKAPALPATTLAKNCYNLMFMECNYLKQAPQLPATKLADRCYQEMFYSCARLEKAPELPATSLAMRCYSGMFSKCKILAEAPLVAATSLTAEKSCNDMFMDCAKLTSLKLSATSFTVSAISGFLSGAGNSSSVIYVPKGMASNEILKAEVPSSWKIVEQN